MCNSLSLSNHRIIYYWCIRFAYSTWLDAHDFISPILHAEGKRGTPGKVVRVHSTLFSTFWTKTFESEEKKEWYKTTAYLRVISWRVKAGRFVRGWSVSETGARSPEQLYSRPRKRSLSTTGMWLSESHLHLAPCRPADRPTSWSNSHCSFSQAY